jgi:hypothetical protein
MNQMALGEGEKIDTEAGAISSLRFWQPSSSGGLNQKPPSEDCMTALGISLIVLGSSLLGSGFSCCVPLGPKRIE